MAAATTARKIQPRRRGGRRAGGQSSVVTRYRLYDLPGGDAVVFAAVVPLEGARGEIGRGSDGIRNLVSNCRQMPQVHDDGVAIFFGPVREAGPRHHGRRDNVAVGERAAPEHALDFDVGPAGEAGLLVRREIAADERAVARVKLQSAP